MRLAVVASHPIQYQAPLFRRLAQSIDLTVFFAHRASGKDQAQAGFGVGFEWDVDLLSGYDHCFLNNVARMPALDHFGGCNTPEIAERLKGGGFDVLLVMGWHLRCFWQAIWGAKRLGIPVIVRGDSHLNTPRSLAKRLAKEIVYPFVLRAFDAALYVGKNSRIYWEHYNYPSERLFFSPNCVDNEWFAARATSGAGARLRAMHCISADARVLLLACKLVPLKRPLDVVAAGLRLTSRGFPVTILVAGAGPLADQMTSACSSTLPLVHLGFCNQSQMPEVYAAADVMVLASDSESWGLVANEALACGTPIVVSDACGCAPDLADDERVGATFPVGDVEIMADVAERRFKRTLCNDAITAKIKRYSVEAAADGIVQATMFVTKRS